MQPSDLARLIDVRCPRLSPDGRWVAFVVQRVDMDAGCYRSAIWRAAVDGSIPPAPFSAGTERDSDPVWSPDGARLAFTRSPAVPGEDGHHALLVAPADGPGEVVAVATHEHEGFGGLCWSPDGRQLAYTQRVRDERYAPADDRLRPPRRVDVMRNRIDSVGWTVDRRSHVFAVAANGTAAPRQLTDGPFDHGEPAWSPDSARLAYAAARHGLWDLDHAVDLWLVDLDHTATPDCITETAQTWGAPSWSPDGARIAAFVADNRTLHRHSQVAVIDLASGSETVLTTDLDRQCTPWFSARPPAWAGNETLLFTAEDGGRVPLLRVAADGSDGPDVVVGGDRWVTDFDATADGATIAFCATSQTRPTELFAMADGRESNVTALQADFLATCPAVPAERFAVASLAGDGDIDAWIMQPPDFAPTNRYPLLLLIHGGPEAQHGERWFDEVQMYASAGYVVVFANPHGSTGFTEAWARAVRSPLAKDDPGSGWGGVDFDDLMAVVDAALEREQAIDPDRMGILGGSYGGYMTSWAIGHTDRFAAACSERAANNLLTLEWASDAAGGFGPKLGLDPFEQPDEYLRMSPVSYVKDIHTPLLILHSDEDLRCDVEQANQLFGMLRFLGREVEYWRFPAETHEMSRSGSPIHRKQRAEIILDWFNQQLLS